MTSVSIASSLLFIFGEILQLLRHGLGVRIAGSHPAGPGSIPGAGILILRQVKIYYRVVHQVVH